MKGDFSRNSFDRTKHFSTVRLQQGRVQLDADWNEQMDILETLGRSTRVDLFGANGTPASNEGFAIRVLGGNWPDSTFDNTLTIGAGPESPLSGALLPGRYYVDGVLCEIEPGTGVEGETLITEQPDLPASVFLSDVGTAAAGTSFLIYLDTWERHLTGLEDSTLTEPALGGAESASRTKTVWHVRALNLTDPGYASQDPASFGVRWLPTHFKPSAAKMSARAAVANSEGNDDPCVIPAESGYRGLENLLYRVEIHKTALGSGEVERAFFKWSRNNASVSAVVKEISAATGTAPEASSIVTVDGLTTEQLRALEPGRLLEITDADRRRTGVPGVLARLNSAPQGAQLSVTWVEPADGVHGLGTGRLLIPWDCDALIEIDATKASDFYSLGSEGVQVKFGSAEESDFRVGDYWLVAARAAIAEEAASSTAGQVLWPTDTVNGEQVPRLLPPVGVQHHYCALARVTVVAGQNGALSWGTVEDLRRKFPAVTEMVLLRYVSGDRQEGPAGEWLSAPIEVGVAFGPVAVSGQAVVLQVVEGGGKLETAPTGDGTSWISVTTDAEGIARGYWKLGSASTTQRVRAYLPEGAEAGQNPPPMKGLPVELTARLAVSSVLRSYASLEDMYAELQPGELGILNGYDPDREPLSTVWTETHDSSNSVRCLEVRSDQNQVYYLKYNGNADTLHLVCLSRSGGTERWTEAKLLSSGLSGGYQGLAVDGEHVFAQVRDGNGDYRITKFSRSGEPLVQSAPYAYAARALYSDGYRLFAIATANAYGESKNLTSLLTNLSEDYSTAVSSALYVLCSDGSRVYVGGSREAHASGGYASLYAYPYSLVGSDIWHFDFGKIGNESEPEPLSVHALCCDQDYLYAVGGPDSVPSAYELIRAFNKVTGAPVWSIANDTIGWDYPVYGASIACDGRYIYLILIGMGNAQIRFFILDRQGRLLDQMTDADRSVMDFDGDSLFFGKSTPTLSQNVLERVYLPCNGRAFRRAGTASRYRVPFAKPLLPQG